MWVVVGGLSCQVRAPTTTSRQVVFLFAQTFFGLGWVIACGCRSQRGFGSGRSHMQPTHLILEIISWEVSWFGNFPHLKLFIWFKRITFSALTAQTVVQLLWFVSEIQIILRKPKIQDVLASLSHYPAKATVWSCSSVCFNLIHSLIGETSQSVPLSPEYH